MRFETKAIHAGQAPDPNSGDVMPPIHLSTTFAQEEPGKHKGYDYSRGGNPTRKNLEEALAALENAKYAHAFSSGLAATSAIAGLLKPGDHLLCIDDTYGGTFRLFERVLRPYGLDFSYVDMSDASKLKLQKNTKMIWLETPTNPLLKIADIAAIAGRKEKALLVVDNTFASPYLQNPLDLGADIVMHSTTKYLNGHSDVIGGCAMLNDEKIHEHLTFYQLAVGGVPSPFDCWLANRSLKTLAVRMKAHCENGQAVAGFLSEHKKVSKVYYPGLPDHPGHEIAKRQMRGFSGMLSFEVKGDFRKFLKALKILTLAESLGGIESLINHPAIMTHASLPSAERARRGISDSLLRLSVGIENIQDLIEDLDQALAKA
ncbi:PLP-dependent transferase [Candidatus Acetothermia bacterium]|nr:PLP-dependent transferase [Candidatus Acetothermia bacterium]